MPRPKPGESLSSVLTLDGPPPYSGSILDAMDLAGLTGESWAVWRIIWKAIFGYPMDDAELAIFRRHTGRTTPPQQQVREFWGIIGARGGKSTNAGLLAGWFAIHRDYRPLLGRGERAVIPVIAADRKQASQILNALKGFVTAPEILPYVALKNDKPRIMATAVEFVTGVTVQIATASFRTTRGYTIPAFLADEVAQWRSEYSADPDREILNALRRGTMTMPSPLLFAISTPYARKGELYRNHQEHFERDGDSVLVWNADTLSMHRDELTTAFVASEFERDPTFSASEYGEGGRVIFRADVESFVDPTAVDAAIVAGRVELAPMPGIRYFAFTDPSGGSQDSWPVAISHIDGDNIVLDAVRERVPPFSPANVAEEFSRFAKSYGIAEIEGDHYGGEFPRELFRKHGIAYRTAAMPKAEIYREWLPLLNARRLALLDIRRMKAQFCGLERKVARSGQESIDHAPGGHDDVANAVAGALVRANRTRPVRLMHPISITRVSPWIK